MLGSSSGLSALRSRTSRARFHSAGKTPCCRNVLKTLATHPGWTLTNSLTASPGMLSRKLKLKIKESSFNLLINYIFLILNTKMSEDISSVFNLFDISFLIEKVVKANKRIWKT